MTDPPKTSRVGRLQWFLQKWVELRVLMKMRRLNFVQNTWWIGLLALVAAGLVAPSESMGQAGIPYKVKPGDTNPVDDVIEEAPEVQSPVSPPAKDVVEAPAELAPSVDLLKETQVQRRDYRSLGRRPSYFHRLWEERRIATAKNEFVKGHGLLKELVEKKVASGWPNIFRYGAVLARESEMAREQGQLKLSLELADAAVVIAPDLASTHLAQLKSRFGMGLPFVRLLESFFAALKAGYLEAPNLQRRVGNFLLIGIAVLLISFTLFGVMAAARHFRAFVHDLLHFLPGSAGRWQTSLIAGSMLLAPVIFQFGLLGSALWWVVMAGLYFGPRERILAGLFCLLFVLLPGVAPQLAGHFFYQGSRSEAAYYAARDLFGEPYATRLRSYPEQTPNEYLIFAMRDSWSGNVGEALATLEKQKHLMGLSDEYWVALGNTRFRSGKKGEAIGSYVRAIEHSQKSVPAYFNLSRAYYSLAQHSSGAEAHARAVSLDHELVTHFESLVPGYYDVVDANLSFSVAGGEFLWDASKRPLVGDALWNVIGAPLDRRSASLLSLGALIALVLLAAIRERVRTAGICHRCGQPSCGRCAQGLPSLRHCWECHRSFIDTFGIDKHLRIRKQLQAHRYHARRVRLVRWISLVMAGMGQIANGRALRGGLLLIAYLGGISGFVVGVGALAAPVNSGSDSTGFDITLSVVVILGAHLIAQLTRKERVG